MVLGAVQAGILAACIVLFVPMGMAGWHLSRNRILFFSATLFITLAVGVHLMPYFPNLDDIISSFTLNSPTKPPFPCLSVINEIDWEEEATADDNLMSSSKVGPTGAKSSGETGAAGVISALETGTVEAISVPQIGAIGADSSGEVIGPNFSPQMKTIAAISTEKTGAVGSNSSLHIGTLLYNFSRATGANALPQIGSIASNSSGKIESIGANSSLQIGEIGANNRRTWRWNYRAVSSGCGFQKLNKANALDLLNGSWVVVAGDSEARYLVLSLLELVLKSVEPIREKLFKRHSNFKFVLEERDLKVDFIWAPFLVNLTKFVGDLRRIGIYPNVLVMGAELWHMLHVTNASHYGEGLRRVKNSVVSLLPLSSTQEFSIDTGSTVQAPYMFWIGLPTLVNSILNTEAKRQRMTREMCAAYARELERSQLLQPAGGPLVLLDIGGLSQGCGLSCTDDGMHYKGAVYEAAVQILLNALIIETQQQPAG